MKTHGGFYLSQVHQLGGRVFERILKASEVDTFNGPQGRILYVLWENEKLSISEIGKLTSLAKTTLTSMLDRMEAMGLIEKIQSEDDRRQIFVSITEKSRQYKKIYDQVSKRMNMIFYKNFAPDEISLFERMLKQIIDNLENSEAE